jgi:transposase
LDEVWFSRLAQPNLSAWTPTKTRLHLFEKELPAWEKTANVPKALACYGLYLPDRSDVNQRMLLRFVEGRPVSSVTSQFLEWICSCLVAMDKRKRVLLLFWDNASWHVSREVKNWIRRHNRIAKKEGALRLLVVRLPKKSPWLNNIEAKWVHGKRAVVEPQCVLPSDELEGRLCRYYRCERMERLQQ